MPSAFFFNPELVFLQSRRDGMIIEKQMNVDEPRRGEMIVNQTRIIPVLCFLLFDFYNIKALAIDTHYAGN